MLGRGALAMPNLAQVIKNHKAHMPWEQVKGLLVRYSGYELFGDKGKYYPNRVKQWLGYLSRQYPEAEALFMRIRALKSADEILQQIQS